MEQFNFIVLRKIQSQIEVDFEKKSSTGNSQTGARTRTLTLKWQLKSNKIIHAMVIYNSDI